MSSDSPHRDETKARDPARTLTTNGRLVVISGPSGAGKSSLLNELLKKPGYVHSTSATTRTQRPGETEGFHYTFIDHEAFKAMVAQGKFLEHAEVHGNQYGTLIQNVQSIVDEGQICVLDIDVQGARALRSRGVDCLFVFVSPPSLTELERRLRARGTDSDEAIRKRLANARAEIEEGKQYNLNVTNHRIEDSVAEVERFLEDRGVCARLPNPPSANRSCTKDSEPDSRPTP